MTAADRGGWHLLVTLAATLAESGEEAEAADLLAGLLCRLDPVTAVPDEDLIEGAVLYSRIVEPTPRLVPDDVAWARWADRAARARYGPDHPATLTAMDNLAAVLHVRGRFGEADTMRRDLIQRHRDRGDIDAHLIQRLELAETLHAAGRCAAAIGQADAAWREWITRHDPAGPDSRGIALQLIGLFTACELNQSAQAVTDLARPHRPAHRGPIQDAYDRYVMSLPAMVIRHRRFCTIHHRGPAASRWSNEGNRR